MAGNLLERDVEPALGDREAGRQRTAGRGIQQRVRVIEVDEDHLEFASADAIAEQRDRRRDRRMPDLGVSVYSARWGTAIGTTRTGPRGSGSPAVISRSSMLCSRTSWSHGALSRRNAAMLGVASTGVASVCAASNPKCASPR
jgi:hypothetical protein